VPVPYVTRISMLALAAVLVAWPVAVKSQVHLALVRSQPDEDEVVGPTVSAIRLWFNERPDYPRARISLRGPSGDVEMGSPEMTDHPHSVVARIRRRLEPGDYRVSWEAAGSDGDLVYDRYDFRVRSSSQQPPSTTAP
jgi:methionine-rich copper-binding protein CopC